MSKVIPNPGAYLDELDRIYPDRHKKIHLHCCKKCPAMINKIMGEVDEESDYIKNSYPKEFIATEFLFVCAWRTSKLCKGNCDDMGIDQEFLNNLYNK